MTTTRIHPLSGAPIKGKANGYARFDAVALIGGGTRFQQQRQETTKAAMSYDAARSGTDLDKHWAWADAYDSDNSNSAAVRHTLIRRSRYEQGSNGYYDGVLSKHANLIIGTGPTLRMLTGNREFNQLVEREFHRWTQAVQLRRKLWAMAHARYGDGEVFAVLQTNPAVRNGVQLDFMPLEAEQCQTPHIPFNDRWYIDGIKRDEFGNVLWYDILPVHPGGSQFMVILDAVSVPSSGVLHWFKLVRPGAGRGKPDLTSSMNVGATSRRHREATVAAAETAADLSAISTTNQSGASDEPDPVAPFTGIPLPKRTWLFNPMGWDVHQMKGEHPNAEYADFHRLQLSELAAPIGQPYNVAAGDSSTYSFASGKLDTLSYRQAIDIERADCDDLVLDPLFAAWFREWTIVAERRDIPPNHQWDWPTHPVIDAVAEASATSTKLQNGSISLRQVYSDQGQDYEDALAVMAEDWFGEATDETVAKARQINVLRNVPQSAIQYVASILGVKGPQPTGGPVDAPNL